MYRNWRKTTAYRVCRQQEWSQELHLTTARSSPKPTQLLHCGCPPLSLTYGPPRRQKLPPCPDIKAKNAARSNHGAAKIANCLFTYFGRHPSLHHGDQAVAIDRRTSFHRAPSAAAPPGERSRPLSSCGASHPGQREAALPPCNSGLNRFFLLGFCYSQTNKPQKCV